MITYKKGTLFNSNAEAYAHGCNTKGKMGAGIATEFKFRYPEMFKDYQRRCKNGLFLPGQGYIFKNQTFPHIINLGTQEDGCAKIEYVDSALKWLNDSYEEIGINSVAMPQIASGLGKIEWKTVEEVLLQYFKNSNLKVEIWVR